MEELRKQLDDKDIDFDRKIRTLRAQYDKMRYDHETEEIRERLTGKKKETKGVSGVHGGGNSINGNLISENNGGESSMKEAVLQSRVKDLERQLAMQKSYYLGKLRSKEPLVPGEFGNQNKGTYNHLAKRSRKNEPKAETEAKKVKTKADLEATEIAAQGEAADNFILELLKEKQEKIEQLEKRLISNTNGNLLDSQGYAGKPTGQKGKDKKNMRGGSGNTTSSPSTLNIFSEISPKDKNSSNNSSNDPNNNNTNPDNNSTISPHSDPVIKCYIENYKAARGFRASRAMLLTPGLLRLFLGLPFAQILGIIQRSTKEICSKDPQEIANLLAFLKSVEERMEQNHSSIFFENCIL